MKIGTRDKGMDMVGGMVMEIKSQQRRAHGGSATQTQTYYTTPKGRVSYRNTPSRRIGGGQGDGNGDGEDKDDKIGKDIEILDMTLKKRMRKRVILKTLLSLKLLHSN